MLTESQCVRCARGQGCGGIGLFNHGVAAVQLHCETHRAIRQSEEVLVEFDDAGSPWLWLVVGAYGLPTFGLLCATSIASFVWPAASSGAHFSAYRDLILAVAALIGLAGGVFAWRSMAPVLLSRWERGLCLQSARIVTEHSQSAPDPVLPQSRSYTSEKL